ILYLRSALHGNVQCINTECTPGSRVLQTLVAGYEYRDVQPVYLRLPMPNDQYQEVLIVIVTSVLVLGLLIGTLVFLMLNYQKKRFLHIEEKRNLQATYERNLLLSRLE